MTLRPETVAVLPSPKRLIEALRDGGLEAGATTKRLLGQADREMRRLFATSDTTSQQLSPTWSTTASPQARLESIFRSDGTELIRGFELQMTA